MTIRGLDRAPLHLAVGSLCAGLASANAFRLTGPMPALLVILLVLVAAASGSPTRLVLVCVAACIAGITWGSLRIEAIDRSPLRSDIGRAGRLLVEVTATPRRGGFSIRAQARTLRFEGRSIREPVYVELPRGRAPPQGARLEVLAEIKAPRPAEHGFDEARYLRRHGIHVVLRVDRWRVVGRRGGIGGVADRLHTGMTAALASGNTGERRQLLVGIVLGDDSEVPGGAPRPLSLVRLVPPARCMGQNIALVAAGVLAAAWLLGVSRFLAELGAVAAIGAYVLAVGAQPSVVRAGVAALWDPSPG